MRRRSVFHVAAFTLGLLLLCGSEALATVSPGCAALGGDPGSPPGECLIDAVRIAGGTFTVPETLHITGTGAIDASSALKLVIGGDLIMDSGGLIDGNVAGCGFGLEINLTASGDVSLAPGSIIRSDSCSGGAIAITSRTGSIDTDGLVESVGSLSGTGANQKPGGGMIALTAACNLTVSDAGKVSSRGKDPGADLVRLVGGCRTVIDGLVESTGIGHVVPSNPQNHCDNTFRPDKPGNSTACVEVWAGESLALESTGSHHGQINADTGGTGGSNGTSWIDLFARGTITVTGATSGSTFSAHANGNAGTNDNGGAITVKSRDASIRASGLAFQADSTGAGGQGGNVTIQAALAVNLDDAQIFARGDFNATGGYGTGGSIAVRSFSGSFSWSDTAAAPVATGNVQPTGTTVPAARRGVITFFNCPGGTVTTTGTQFPFIGTATAPTTVTVAFCGGSPTFESYVSLPACLCGGCFCLSSFFVSGEVLTLTGSLAGVNEVDFNSTCDPGGVVVKKKDFLSQTDNVITLTLPGGTSGMHVILVNASAASSSCSTDTLP